MKPAVFGEIASQLRAANNRSIMESGSQATQRAIELNVEAEELEQEAQALAHHISKIELPASDGGQEEEKLRLNRLILHRIARASVLRAQLAFPFDAEADDLQRELQLLSAKLSLIVLSNEPQSGEEAYVCSLVQDCMARVKALRARSTIPFDTEVDRAALEVTVLSRTVTKTFLPDGPQKEQEEARLNALIQDRVTHLRRLRALRRRAIAFYAKANVLERQAQEFSCRFSQHWKAEKKARLNGQIQDRMIRVKMLRAAADEIAANAEGAGPDWRLQVAAEVDAGEEEEEKDEFVFPTSCGHKLKVVREIFNCKTNEQQDCEAVRVYSNEHCSGGFKLIAVYPTEGCQGRAKRIPDVCQEGACAPFDSLRVWLRDLSQEGYTFDSVDDLLAALEDNAGES